MVDIPNEPFRRWFQQIINSPKPSVNLEMLFELKILQAIIPTLHQEREKFDRLFINLDKSPYNIQYWPETKLTFLLYNAKEAIEAELLALGYEQAAIKKVKLIVNCFDIFLQYQHYLDQENGLYARTFLAKLRNSTTKETYPDLLDQLKAFLYAWDSIYLTKLESILDQPVLTSN